MNILSVVLLLVFVGFVLAILKRSYSSTAGTVGINARNAGSRKSRKTLRARSPYRATAIVQGTPACKAVQAIGNRRFLDAERRTPRIPLPACNSLQCNCQYRHLEDRREAQGDRRHPNTLRAELYVGTGAADRRQRKRGRRKTDWA